MNIKRSEARIKCAIFWVLMAAVVAVVAAIAAKLVGLWTWGAFITGAGAFFVTAIVTMNSFCRTDEELAAIKAERDADAAARKPYKDANAAIEIVTATKPGAGQPKVAPTVGKTAPKVAAAPAPKPAPAPEPKPAPAPAPAVAEIGKRPAALSGPRAGGADDLKRIKGVGPKLEKLCNALGFYHYDQIAKWTADEVAWVDENLEGFKGRVSRDDWVAQARILAQGGETEFSRKYEE
ncbi:putative flap endonuclease-1-like 5' DNA nuclease [Rhodovulum bhavnagarense]|uniref:Putative flap endonuclease-1-like 5' DNA nuclease n=1 Tax=Rhodovulum bhavnagarense TaxID=992286 RepID=A0A4R2RG94_9RHOB|nr:putative flap endonuclease-1-like 5' DNA nuclease [Rhodovulum bhavnagarense]